MSVPASHSRAAILVAALLVPAAANAHGVIGARFFPATISSDDPFAADELALPTITIFNHETDTDFDYSKSIFPGFAIDFGMGYVDAHPPGGGHASGFSNLDVAPAMELFRSPEHEFIFSAGVDWEIGGSGSRSVADRLSMVTPPWAVTVTGEPAVLMLIPVRPPVVLTSTTFDTSAPLGSTSGDQLWLMPLARSR